MYFPRATCISFYSSGLEFHDRTGVAMHRERERGRSKAGDSALSGNSKNANRSGQAVVFFSRRFVDTLVLVHALPRSRSGLFESERGLRIRNRSANGGLFPIERVQPALLERRLWKFDFLSPATKLPNEGICFLLFARASRDACRRLICPSRGFGAANVDE